MNDIKMGNIEIVGLRDLEQKLLGFSDKLAKNILQDSVKAGAKVIKDKAVEIAPKSIAPHILQSYASSLFKNFKTQKMGIWVLPGNLKKMIRVKVDTSQSRGYKITYEVYVKNKEAWYWKFLEFGTSKMPPKPFMRPAFEQMKESAIAAIEQRIKEGIAANS